MKRPKSSKLLTSSFSFIEKYEMTQKVLHHRNNHGQTLLKILISQDNNLKVFRDILLKMERAFHPNLIHYSECLKQNLGTSGVNFINGLCAAFPLKDPKSIKSTVQSSASFYLLGSSSVKVVRGILMKLSPEFTMNAVKEGRAEYTPSPITRVLIWAQHLLRAFIPFTILFLDVVFDIILVANYWNQYQTGMDKFHSELYDFKAYR